MLTDCNMISLKYFLAKRSDICVEKNQKNPAVKTLNLRNFSCHKKKKGKSYVFRMKKKGKYQKLFLNSLILHIFF